VYDTTVRGRRTAGNWEDERKVLAAWAAALPKPLGLMAGYDVLGRILRVEKVKQPLAETDWTLDQIAPVAGFKHTSYLSVAFLRETGLAPGEYRATHRPRMAQ